MLNTRPKTISHGFTIVELLVVIVVIGILVTITIVSYTDIQQKAVVASLTSDLDNASKQLKLYYIDHGTYPTSLDANNCPIGSAPSPDTRYCIKPSSGNTYTYKASVINSNIFCLTATKGAQSYNIFPDTQPLAGPCPVLSLDAGNKTSYPGSGVTWNDLSGWDNNGVMDGGVIYTSANGGVMSFDGVDDTISTNSQPAIQISPNNFTISGYLKPDDLTSRFITPYSNGRDQYLGYDAASRRIYVAVTELSDVNNRSRYAPIGSVPLNVWTYFAVTINDKNIKIFINGQLVSEYNETISIADWSSLWTIGSRGVGTFWYKGLIGEINVFNRELVDSEVLYNFNTTKSRYGL